jgi:hypothetical protein
MKILILSLMFFLLPASLVLGQSPVTRSSYACLDGSLPVSTSLAKTFAGAGNSEIVALAADKQIRAFRWYLQSTADVNIKFVYGTGTNCDTGETDLVGKISPFATVDRPVDSEELFPPIIVPVAQALCIDSSGAATLTGWVIFCRE